MKAGVHFIAAMLLMLWPWASLAIAKYECPQLSNTLLQTLPPMYQGKDGWFFRESDLKQHYALLPETADYLSRLNQALNHKGTELWIISLPPRGMVAQGYLPEFSQETIGFSPPVARKSYLAYEKSLKSTGASVVSVLSATPQNSFFFKRDHHWRPEGAKFTAEAIAQALSEEKPFRQLSAQRYQTVLAGEAAMKGKIAEELSRLCSDAIPAEGYPSYHTQRQSGSATGERALFGDDSLPQIVLAGSSYSALEELNFSGFLSQSLAREVANYAISGGQLFNSLLSYLSLDEAERGWPSYLLWEHLAHYDVNEGSDAFRQMIPAIYGECESKYQIAQQDWDITTSPSQPIDLWQRGGAGEALSGTDYYLALQFDRPSIAQFTLELEYENGDGETVIFDQREHYQRSGRYFWELSDELTAPLGSIRLTQASTQPFQLNMQLCRKSDIKPSERNL